MSFTNPQALLAVLVFAATLLAVIYTRLRRPSSGLPLPPGPPSDSIFGTSFQSELYVLAICFSSRLTALKLLPTFRAMDTGVWAGVLIQARSKDHRRRRKVSGGRGHHGERRRRARRPS